MCYFDEAVESCTGGLKLLHRSKCYIECTQDRKDFDQAANYLKRASAMYHESGHGDTAGQVLAKAAK